MFKSINYLGRCDGYIRYSLNDSDSIKDIIIKAGIFEVDKIMKEIIDNCTGDITINIIKYIKYNSLLEQHKTFLYKCAIELYPDLEEDINKYRMLE